MSNNRNFNANFRGSSYTFRYVPDFPPPPLPPPILPPMRPQFFPPQPLSSQPTIAEITEKNDRDFIKRFENQISITPKKCKVNATTISHIREEIQSLLLTLKDFESQLNHLRENIDKLPDDEWEMSVKVMEEQRKTITLKLENYVGSYMDMSRKLIAKRTAKRLRLKRLKNERKLAKNIRMKQLEERSRKIDENLQKIKDDILQAQKAQEAKLEADVVLREVRRQKQDAKKCILKLDALLKLRKARQNTAKGRGEAVSEKDVTTFANNVEKLKALWNQKLLNYEKEESELNVKLTEGAAATDTSLGDTVGVEANFAKWRELLFGDSSATPQVDFQGNIQRFIDVRLQWDQYLNKDGTPLPVGWVTTPLEH